MSDWVVVTLSSSDCEIFPGGLCVQEVIVRDNGTPFQSKAEADAEAATWPDAFRPHTMILNRSTAYDVPRLVKKMHDAGSSEKE